jgi:peptidyl-prolyl cis-trans isomerase C
MRTVISHPNTARPVVSVNEVVITSTAIAREVQNHSGSSPKEIWDEAARALVVRELLVQRARALGLTAEPRSEDGLRETEEEALIRVLLETEVRTPRADGDACRRYYEANKRRFRSADLFEPLHILFKADRQDEAAYTAALARAQATLAEVTASPARFEELARALSDCPSGSDGGRLGQILRGETTLEFEAALLKLAAGQTCAEPVRTRYGVHIVRLEHRIAGRTLPFEQVRDRIAAYLEEKSWRQAVAQYVSLLAGGARISGCEIRGSASPLVQ